MAVWNRERPDIGVIRYHLVPGDCCHTPHQHTLQGRRLALSSEYKSHNIAPHPHVHAIDSFYVHYYRPATRHGLSDYSRLIAQTCA